MEREVRFWLWGCILFGFLLAGGVGLAADDPGMVKGAIVAALGGFLLTPFVARMWRKP